MDTAERGKQLVRDALEKIGKPHTSHEYSNLDEDIVDEVYITIANSPELFKEYKDISKYHSKGATSLNQSIGFFVKGITKGQIYEKAKCEKGGLAKDYSKLKWS